MEGSNMNNWIEETYVSRYNSLKLGMHLTQVKSRYLLEYIWISSFLVFIQEMSKYFLNSNS